MKTYIKIFLLTSLFVTYLMAAENFSEMSTQELIAIMGYVKSSETKEFQRELQSRVKSMSVKEQEKYTKNLSKLK